MTQKTMHQGLSLSFGLACLVLGLLPRSGLAEEKKDDKGQYNLFNPTPREKMRDLQPDRPDLTESPYTVDAGHFQLETDIVSFVKDRNEETGELSEAYAFNVLNAKVGLTNDIDLQTFIGSYLLENSSTKRRGIGNISVRVKWNFLGNDSGPIALGLMPVVTFPTGTNDVESRKVEGGLIFPIALVLPSEFSLGMTFLYRKAATAIDENYHSEFASSFSLSRSIAGPLEGYMELFSLSSNEAGASWVSTFDTGMTYKLTPDIQLDTGINIGLTAAANDLNPFVGITARF